MFMPGRMRKIDGRRLNHGSYIPEEPKTETKTKLDSAKEQGTTSTSTTDKTEKEDERDAV